MDNLSPSRSMRRFLCFGPFGKCNTVWIEQPDGSLIKENPEAVCYDGTISPSTRDNLLKFESFKEITDDPR